MSLQETTAVMGVLPHIGRRIALWLQEMRLPFLVVSVLPVIFGALVARSTHIAINFPVFVLAFAAAVFVHVGANVINDYFDFRNGTDAVNREFVHGFTGGSRVIQEGGLSGGEVLGGAILFLTAGFAIILYLAARSGNVILAMGTAAVLAAITYSVFLHSLLVGELIVGLCFGTLIPAGSFFVQAGFVSREVVFASVPLGLMVFLILFINEIPDYAADKNSGKRTLVVRLGRRRASFLYGATWAAIYAYIAVAALVLSMPVLMFCLLTLPVAFRSSRRLSKYYDFPAKLKPSIVATIALFTLNALVLLAAFFIEGGRA